MLQDTITALKKAGLNISVPKCQWMTNAEVTSDFNLEIDGHNIEKVDTITLLGCLVSMDCDNTKEVRSRIQKAWNYFYANITLFMNKNAAMAKRIWLMNKTLMKSLLWGMETLSLTKHQMQLIDQCQTHMIAKMLKLGRRMNEGESWVDWQIRRVRSARWFIKFESGVGYASEQYLAKFWSWAGHVARLPTNRWAYRVTSWANLRWKRMGCLNEAYDCYKKEYRWKRRGLGGSNGHTWNWDRMLQDYSEKEGLNWWALAMSREAWNAEKIAFVLRHRPPEPPCIILDKDIDQAAIRYPEHPTKDHWHGFLGF